MVPPQPNLQNAMYPTVISLPAPLHLTRMLPNLELVASVPTDTWKCLELVAANYVGLTDNKKTSRLFSFKSIKMLIEAI